MDGTHSIQGWLGNFFSLGAIGASLLGYLPAVGALIAVIWYTIQIYESVTVQRWLAARRLRQIVALKAKLLALETLPPVLPPPA
jgi:hypothetical protein